MSELQRLLEEGREILRKHKADEDRQRDQERERRRIVFSFARKLALQAFEPLLGDGLEVTPSSPSDEWLNRDRVSDIVQFSIAPFEDAPAISVGVECGMGFRDVAFARHADEHQPFRIPVAWDWTWLDEDEGGPAGERWLFVERLSENVSFLNVALATLEQHVNEYRKVKAGKPDKPLDWHRQAQQSRGETVEERLLAKIRMVAIREIEQDRRSRSEED